MSIRRMIAVGLIFALGCAGWWTLGTATAFRSSTFSARLGSHVEALWGVPLRQDAPSVGVQIPGSEQMRWVMPAQNEVKVRLDTDYRKKGLIWYPTYVCSFAGRYTISNEESVTQKVRVQFRFPAAEGTYDNFLFAIDGKPATAAVDTKEGVAEILEIEPGQQKELTVTYKTRGIREWRYRLDPNVGRVQNLAVTVETSFSDVDYPEGCLSPMTRQAAGTGMRLQWAATDLITREDVGIVIPEKLNPGPVTTRITFFAPVCLLYFFVLVATINIRYGIPIHPMHYLFVAAGFFAFHLLLSYMVGLFDLHVSFAVSAAVSVGLVTSYLAAALGRQFPWKVAAAGQVIFLVLFSYSFFFTGITGLTVAIGSVLTLAVLMRVTARTDWSAVFARPASVPKVVVPPIPSAPADAEA